MKITVFTSNQPRHLALLSALSGLGEEIYAIQECSTVRPGEVADFFRKSDVMRDYFRRVIAAEKEVFGPGTFCPRQVRQRAIRMGDLNLLEFSDLGPSLEADIFVVFGSSYIKRKLADFLVEHGAYNIHMGVSPYYRGSSTNFWALYDRRPGYVGATIHLLTSGLDSGPILFHALPPTEAIEPFLLGMRAVRAAHEGLVRALGDGKLAAMLPAEQDKTRELRYSRNVEFTDEVAAEYLGRLPSPQTIRQSLEARNMMDFVRPFVGG